MHRSPSILAERLWSQTHELLDAHRDPMTDPAFADAYADALGQALEREDHTDLAELERLLATMQALRPALTAPLPHARRFPWAASLAAALLLMLSQRALQAPRANSSSGATPAVIELAESKPQAQDWSQPLQPAATQPRSALVRLKIERNAVLPRTNAHASLKLFATTSKQNR